MGENTNSLNEALKELPAESPLTVHLCQLVGGLGTAACARLQFHGLQGHGHGLRWVQASELRGFQGPGHQARAVGGVEVLP